MFLNLCSKTQDEGKMELLCAGGNAEVVLLYSIVQGAYL